MGPDAFAFVGKPDILRDIWGHAAGGGAVLNFEEIAFAQGLDLESWEQLRRAAGSLREAIGVVPDWQAVACLMGLFVEGDPAGKAGNCLDPEEAPHCSEPREKLSLVKSQ